MAKSVSGSYQAKLKVSTWPPTAAESEVLLLLEFWCGLAEEFGVTADHNRDPSSLPDSAPIQNPALGEVGGEYWRWCPRCGHELHNEKCKLRCPRCHYFLSCSDFD
jgi:hypothetical protein